MISWMLVGVIGVTWFGLVVLWFWFWLDDRRKPEGSA